MTLNRQIIDAYVIIASLKSKSIGKLINIIPGLGLLISSLQGSAIQTHVTALGDSTSILGALPGKLDIFQNACQIAWRFNQRSQNRALKT